MNIIDKGSKFIYKNKIGPNASNPDLVFRWLDRIKKAQDKLHEGKQNPNYLIRLKNIFHKKYIPTQENFPREDFLKFISKAAEEQGYGKITEVSYKAIEDEIKSQKESLDDWIDYFASKDSAAFPVWAKYWAFHGVVKMSGIPKIDPETSKISFSKREKNTFGRFPELNREALAMAVEFITNKVESGVALGETLNQESFRYVYSFFMNKLRKSKFIPELKITEGTWVKYNQGRDPEVLNALVASLNQKNTGWCTAVRATAKAQLEAGDIYIYYSTSTDKNPNPRIAIRMEGNRIAEIRGIGAGQNFDEEITGTNILQEKLKEFGNEADIYQKRIADMEQLTDIKKRFDLEEELTESDLRFLYELDSTIDGFGYEKDNRIFEICGRRDIKKDLVRLTGYTSDEISINIRDAFDEGKKIFVGDLDLSVTSPLKYSTGAILPEKVTGNLDLGNFFNIKGFVLPKYVGGDLDLYSLESSKGLVLPKYIGGTVYFYELPKKDFEKLVIKYPNIKFKHLKY